MEKPDQKRQEEEGGKKRISEKLGQNPRLVAAIAVITIIAAVGGAMYLLVLQTRIYVEKSEISAPTIMLTPSSAGTIDKFFVESGKTVRKNQILAKVGDETIKAPIAGLILSITNTPGQVATLQTPIIRMIDPRELRVTGRLQEDKGLADVRLGQRVVFTVDAYGSKEYDGTVTQIAPAARSSDVVFSISDQREEREFDIEASFDVKAYPELKNGMSAKMWIYK
ncbi:MAG: HlyD family efflux transporter periplasmic adaptor subunit [Candidatus Altiarchaeota archaeon]